MWTTGLEKTALAVHAAHQLRTEFSGGQLYADLRGSHDSLASPHEVAGRFLRALGCPARTWRPIWTSGSASSVVSSPTSRM